MRDTLGVNPPVIYDIGACVLHWTNEAYNVWPSAQYYAFEAMPETEFLYKESFLKGYYNGVLSDKNNKEVTFFQNTWDPGGNSYYRENVEVNPQAEIYFNDSHKRTYHTATLDTIVWLKGFAWPDLIKMDVQGAELDVLKGARNCLDTATNLILELQVVEYNKGAPLRDEVISYLDSIGFKLQNNGPFHNAGPDGDYHFIKS
jgi:FkbM family methyltransferase